MKKIKLKKIKKKKLSSKLSIIIFIIIIAIFLSYQLIKLISSVIGPIYMSYAEAETKKLLTIIINKSVAKETEKKIDEYSIFNIIKNTNGDIQLIEYNSNNVNKMLTEITNNIQTNIRAIEQGNINNLDIIDNNLLEIDENKLKDGIIYEIPIGSFSKSTFLSNLGPKIPVKIILIGDVLSNINTTVKEYGINNALIEVSITVEVTSRINLPFVSKNIKVTNTIPVALKVIQGNIPSYYLNGIKSNSNLITSDIIDK